MPYLVIAYPTLSQEDRQWIQELRERCDTELASVVAPHFTLVFPLAHIQGKRLTEHVKTQVKHFQNISFVLGCALPVKDIVSEESSVFLVPEEGFSTILKLHDTLYRGILASSLRLDIPFLPHLTVGKTSDLTQAKKLADVINQHPLAIKGTIDALDVIVFKNKHVETVEQISLT